MITRLLDPRILVVAALGAFVAFGASAFAAANTVNSSIAGDGSGTVSGYTVSGIHYNLDATNPANIDSIALTLSSAPKAGSTLAIKWGGASYSSCGTPNGTLTTFTCTTTSPQAAVGPAANNALEVVVAD